MINASAPGNLMLMGEHSVLEGELALALAVNYRVEVSLKPLHEPVCRIHSALAEIEFSLDQIPDLVELNFVLEVIRQLAEQLSRGFELSIKSEFSHQVGLGSSAAVTVATLAAVMRYADLDTSKDQIFDRALRVVRTVQQGRGSGADLAASVFGGIVAYSIEPRHIEVLTGAPPITLHYVGYKMKTPDVIRRVEALRQPHPELYADLYHLMGRVTLAAKQAIQHEDWQDLGRLMNQYSGLMDALGVCDSKLAELQYRLRALPEVVGAKISGSGLGDSVITLGVDHTEDLGYLEIPVAVSPRGVEVEGRIDG